MRAKLLKLAGLGFLIGLVAGDLIAWLMSFGSGAPVSAALVSRTGGVPAAFLVQTLLSGLYGAAIWSGMLLYEIESWPLALSTALHYLIVAGLYVPVSLLLGWAKSGRTLLLVELMQFVGFFLIWLFFYFRYKAQARRLNALRAQLGRDRNEQNGSKKISDTKEES